MRIIFVRHGEPDYEHDCLTETGKLQAVDAAERLRNEGIEEIYASPQGRAERFHGWPLEGIGVPSILPQCSSRI